MQQMKDDPELLRKMEQKEQRERELAEENKNYQIAIYGIFCLFVLLGFLIIRAYFHTAIIQQNKIFIPSSPLQVQDMLHDVRLYVEIADTPEKQKNGLMYRTELDANSGMLFIFPEKQPLYMWMKNTNIPLDMLFFDETGKITHIHTNARPHDETLISSQLPVIGVLEVNAGFTQKHHIQVGNYIRHPNIQN